MDDQALCFVIMPFRADLNFFYLYLRRHLQERHGLRVERGDHRVLTVPLLDKIRGQIAESRVVLADISGRNPNVFYELGMAHAMEKPVILLTQDGADDIPTDIRHLEFIRYDLGHDVDVLAKVDNAMHNMLVERYRPLHDRAKALLREFNAATGGRRQEVGAEDFQSAVIQAERAQGLPEATDDFRMANLLLPRIIQGGLVDGPLFLQITNWVSAKYP